MPSLISCTCLFSYTLRCVHVFKRKACCSVFMIVHTLMAEPPFPGQSECQMWPRGCQLTLLSPLDWSKLTHFPILRVPCALFSSPLQLSLALVVFHSVLAQHLQHNNYMQKASCICVYDLCVCSGPLSVLPPCPVSPSSPPLSGKVRNTLRNMIINNPHYSVMHFHQPLLLLPLLCLNTVQCAAASHFHLQWGSVNLPSLLSRVLRGVENCGTVNKTTSVLFSFNVK